MSNFKQIVTHVILVSFIVQPVAPLAFAPMAVAADDPESRQTSLVVMCEPWIVTKGKPATKTRAATADAYARYGDFAWAREFSQTADAVDHPLVFEVGSRKFKLVAGDDMTVFVSSVGPGKTERAVGNWPGDQAEVVADKELGGKSFRADVEFAVSPGLAVRVSCYKGDGESVLKRMQPLFLTGLERFLKDPGTCKSPFEKDGLQAVNRALRDQITKVNPNGRLVPDDPVSQTLATGTNSCAVSMGLKLMNASMKVTPTDEPELKLLPTEEGQKAALASTPYASPTSNVFKTELFECLDLRQGANADYLRLGTLTYEAPKGYLAKLDQALNDGIDEKTRAEMNSAQKAAGRAYNPVQLTPVGAQGAPPDAVMGTPACIAINGGAQRGSALIAKGIVTNPAGDPISPAGCYYSPDAADAALTAAMRDLNFLRPEFNADGSTNAFHGEPLEIKGIEKTQVTRYGMSYLFGGGTYEAQVGSSASAGKIRQRILQCMKQEAGKGKDLFSSLSKGWYIPPGFIVEGSTQEVSRWPAPGTKADGAARKGPWLVADAACAPKACYPLNMVGFTFQDFYTKIGEGADGEIFNTNIKPVPDEELDPPQKVHADTQAEYVRLLAEAGLRAKGLIGDLDPVKLKEFEAKMKNFGLYIGPVDYIREYIRLGGQPSSLLDGITLNVRFAATDDAKTFVRVPKRRWEAASCDPVARKQILDEYGWYNSTGNITGSIATILVTTLVVGMATGGAGAAAAPGFTGMLAAGAANPVVVMATGLASSSLTAFNLLNQSESMKSQIIIQLRLDAPQMTEDQRREVATEEVNKAFTEQLIMDAVFNAAGFGLAKGFLAAAKGMQLAKSALWVQKLTALSKTPAFIKVFKPGIEGVIKAGVLARMGTGATKVAPYVAFEASQFATTAIITGVSNYARTDGKCMNDPKNLAPCLGLSDLAFMASMQIGPQMAFMSPKLLAAMKRKHGVDTPAGVARKVSPEEFEVVVQSLRDDATGEPLYPQGSKSPNFANDTLVALLKKRGVANADDFLSLKPSRPILAEGSARPPVAGTDPVTPPARTVAGDDDGSAVAASLKEFDDTELPKGVQGEELESFARAEIDVMLRNANPSAEDKTVLRRMNDYLARKLFGKRYTDAVEGLRSKTKSVRDKARQAYRKLLTYAWKGQTEDERGKPRLLKDDEPGAGGGKKIASGCTGRG